MSPDLNNKARRWLALYVLCMGELMIVLDTTIVNVALPSIRQDLGFSEASLVWVVNAYILTYGGFLLLGGRLGDIYGPRKLFLAGLGFFTLASVACGFSASSELLVTARAIQGIGGAVVSAIALSLIVNLFDDPTDRAKALGVYSFVCAAGGSIGVLLGGLLTNSLSWNWVFIVNLPLGAVVYALTVLTVPKDVSPDARPRLDMGGAATVTLSLLLAVYAVVNGNAAGWASVQTLGLLATAAVLFVLFIVIEARVAEPLVPLRLFRLRNVYTSNIAGALWAAAMFAWFFIAALYLQLVLDYNPLQVGLAFLPANLIMAACSLGFSAKLVLRFGVRATSAAGLTLAALGLGLLAAAPVDAGFMIHILSPMILLGLGCGVALNPVILAAMSDVAPGESGLASGVVNTSFMMGGALGLAVLASLADARTRALAQSGASSLEALAGGYQAAFIAGGVVAAIAAALCAWLLVDRAQPADGQASSARESVGHA